MKIALACRAEGREEELAQIAERWGLDHDPDHPFLLALEPTHLALYQKDDPKCGGVFVDWGAGACDHRRKFGGGRGQAIAKAVGLNKGATPRVLDATAGLGRDAFVLASLGCEVMMIERNPVVAALLEDGFQRACEDEAIGDMVRHRMHFCAAQSQLALSQLPEIKVFAPEVVYLDPMFPHKKKSALVKKEMRLFQSLVGADLDADLLFEPALTLAEKRVVVKRPDHAGFLAEKTPSMQIETKKNRFDVYVKQGMK